MKEEISARAAALLRACRVAALGTASGGAPAVTMTPFAAVADPFALIVLVSELASHTRAMREEPRVAMMVMEPERSGEPVHALARVSLSGRAREIGGNDAGFEAARSAYSERFPEMSGLFDLGDFRLFAIEPASVRVVTGFAQAASVTPQALAAAVRTAS